MSVVEPQRWKCFIAGAVGGTGVVVSGHPLDTIKVFLQNQKAVSNVGIVTALKKIYSEEGIRGYYKGMSAPLLGVTPLIATSFWGYSIGKSLFHSSNKQLLYHQYFIAGMISGIFTLPIIVPFDRVKCILQTQEQTPPKIGPLQLMKNIIKTEGLTGLYRGSLATFLRDSPGSGLFYVSYEFYVNNLPNFHYQYNSTDQNPNKSPLRIFLAGGMAGITFWLYGIVPDTLKTRHQLSSSGQYRGLTHLCTSIVKNEGVKSLFKGMSPALLRSFPTNSICFLCYEYTLKMLNHYFP